MDFYAAKMLAIAGVLFGTITVQAASPEAQTIIDNANTLDQTVTTQQATIAELQAVVSEPKIWVQSMSKGVVTVNGAEIQAIPCNDASIPVEYQSANPFCFKVIY